MTGDATDATVGGGAPEESAPIVAAGRSGGIVYSARQLKRVREVLARLSGARRAVTFYPPGHPIVRDSVVGLLESIRLFHNEGLDVSLTFFGGEVMFGEHLLAEESVLFDQLIRDMTDSGASSLRFAIGLTSDELEAALTILGADAATIDAKGGIERAMADAGCPHVLVGTVQSMQEGALEADEDEGPKEAAQASYNGAIDFMRDLARLVRSNKAGSAKRVHSVVGGLVDNILDNRWALLELSGLKDYDEYTFFHSVNVAIHSLAIGSLITSDRRFLNSLGVGALMHDIGKLSVDLEVINKTGGLTSEEWDLMRKHPQYGAEIAAALPGLDRSSLVVILEHHMRFDLNGYPERQPVVRQHLTSRITAVADAYDAMTSRRSYSNARLPDEAMEILLQGGGTCFDPVLTRLFVQAMGVYPARSVVRLSGGDVAVVVRSTSDVLSPVVRVVAKRDGERIDPFDLDLSDSSEAEGLRIEACLDSTRMNIDIDELLGDREAAAGEAGPTEGA